MKNKIILMFLIISVMINIIGAYAWSIDTKCRSHWGWSLYSIYPTPTCHVMFNIAPLKILENPPKPLLYDDSF